MKTTLLFCFILVSQFGFSQIDFTANDQVPDYNGTFGFGVNPGTNEGWDDEAEADIAAGNPAFGVQGAGCNTMRPPLPEWFLEFFGYDVRLDEYQYFETLGITDLTVFLGDASDEHRDPNNYCPDHQSLLFDNMYLPIWDNGANGTPINDDNYYAKYVFQTVTIYKDHVKFWEIWNEPDFDYSASGFLDPGQEGNWWENVPDPCDYKLRAPVFHYIRLLRISYEVIKYVDPDAFVAVGGLGFPSFLDIIMRHSDNPNNGEVNAEFPLTGSAYFDALSYHVYPHFSLKEWNNDIGDFDYFRYSDAATQVVVDKKNEFEAVLQDYAYDGITYPEKKFLITESNVPAEKFDPNFFGSVSGQRNFIIKTVIACQKNDILQYHVYKLAEDYPIGEGINEFDRMGLYQNLDEVDQYNQVYTEEGIAYKTTADLIGDAHYDESQTILLALPNNIDGAAFQHPDGSHTYVLWAKTTIDDSEAANASYSFPNGLNINQVERKEWNFSQTQSIAEIGSTNIQLNGAPIFIKDISVAGFPPTANFSYTINTDCVPHSITFSDNSTNSPSNWIWSFPGGNPNISNEQNPVIVYDEAGTYTVNLQISNEFGNDATNTNFQLLENPTFFLDETLCSGDAIIVNGTSYNEGNPSGTEVLINGSSNGCDSTVIVNLNFDEILQENLQITICEGDDFLFNGETLSETGTFIAETVTSGGCDSITTLELSIAAPQFTNLDITILQGESYMVGNSTYNSNGTYTDILSDQNGCDSTVTLVLTVDETNAIEDINDSKKIDLIAYPNPFRGKVNINFIADVNEFSSLEIFDARGTSISGLEKTQYYTNNRFHFEVDFNQQSKGIYFCKIYLNSGIYIQKLILL